MFPEMEVCGGGVGVCDGEVPSSGVNPALVLDGDAEDVVVVEGDVCVFFRHLVSKSGR